MSKKVFFVCSHTHWDREWYGGFQEFRIRLVRLMDKLIELFKRNSEFKCFNLDGQTIVLNDYLEVRPENRKILKRLVSNGRLNIGPWYILPDEFLVSGEATIRNLILGDSVAEGFGKKSLVGYLPDMFGHISQMPQILRSFGIDTAVIWRGLSWERYRPELLWESPDGSQVLTYHLPSCAYCDASFFMGSILWGPYKDKLPLNLKEKIISSDWRDILGIDDAIEYLKIVAKELPKYSEGNCFLLMNGVDHMEPQEEIIDIIERVNKEIPEAEFIHASFDQFFEALKKSIRLKKQKLPIKRGVLRDTVMNKDVGGYILNGVLSSRIYLKIKNQECQTILERWLEPFSTIGWLIGMKYDKNLIWKAWEYLLQNHPHDDIGGCCVDEVHRQMETRFQWSKEISESLLYRVFYNISNRIDTSSFISKGEIGLIVFNSMQNYTSGLLDTRITLSLSRLKELGIETKNEIKSIEAEDFEGNQIPAQTCGIEVKDIAQNYTDGFALYEKSVIIHVKLWLDAIPPLGYKAFKLKILKKPVPKQLKDSDNQILENKFIKAVIKSNGTIDLLDKVTEKRFTNLLYFEDGGDNGDEYNYSYLKNDKVITTLTSFPKIEMAEDGKACKSYRIIHRIKIPKELATDCQTRSSEYVDYEISTLITLGLFARHLEFTTTIKNNAKDHRLRVCFPVNLKTKHSVAEAQFDVIEYPIHIKQPRKDVWIEDQPKQYPQQTFVDVSDGKYGLGIINFGLPEYEVLDNDTRTICLTLLRAVGYLGRYINTRKGPAGPEIETPDAQCMRDFVFRYAVFPHKGRWDKSDIQYQAHIFNARFFTITTDGHKGDLPLQKSFFKIEGDGIILSTIKKAEKENTIIVRVWNSRNKTYKGKIEVAFNVNKAWYCNLKEEDIEALPLVKNQIEFEILPKQIKSIKIYTKR